jgi:hypothetical protein
VFSYRDQGQPRDQQEGYGDRLVDRVMAEEYNLAVQRQDGPQSATPGGILAQIIGWWMNRRAG